MQQPDENYHFDISLSVLNHLGRNLYRNFITVLGEAISNSWDANAKNVWIEIDQGASVMFIKDDGDGMTDNDFRKKFLTIGYSKRKDPSNNLTDRQRPFIGRKGIGKLALLSCAATIEVISKTADTDYIGGKIDNSELDDAIDENTSTANYPLGRVDMAHFNSQTIGHDKGTIIYFSGLKPGIANTIDYLKKAVALYFRFSLVDSSFSIFINGDEITVDNIQKLADETQFLWTLNDTLIGNTLNDPFLEKLKVKSTRQRDLLDRPDISGFIASVKKPKDLKIFGADDEKVGVDLFVNGRLREKDILSHMQSARIPQSYMYGQIHFNSLDEGRDENDDDRFTSSREGVRADDELFKELLTYLKTTMDAIYNQWDDWRLKQNLDGDDDNTARKSKKDRASAKLFNETANEYQTDVDEDTQDLVGSWTKSLAADAEYNFSAYADCFIAENLARKYIKEKNLSPSVQDDIDRMNRNKRVEVDKKRAGNLSIEIRQDNDDLYYMDMEPLVTIIEPNGWGGQPDNMHLDEKKFTPIRNAVMHTSVLTNDAKVNLSAVRVNIKAKIKDLLANL